MKVILCEDVAECRETLYSHIKKYFTQNNCHPEISVYETGEALLADSYALRSAGIAFLDIYMPGINGVDVARKIRETNEDMVFTFTTSSLDHGLDSYAVEALQYLVKPVGYAEVERVLNKCMKLFSDSFKAIEVLSGRLTVRIPLRDIMYIEKFDHTCYIHTPMETIKNYRSLNELEREFAGEPFLRTHRSFIVNMRYIEDIAANEFIMTNGAVVSIRKNNKLAIKQAYRDYLFKHSREM
ncbi:MAG: LytTR family DNA-binding domain-containing protein [Oscillospiraceae bacterium]|jgi:DNA-binding LytR/AlgR family response regulator|nr:LytTR family DNA-binding domain-containing protein [Oscillospiraceae bacterium]